MKPTRNIVKPIKGLWDVKHKISLWAIHNDDDQLGVGKNHEGEKKASENISKIIKSDVFDKLRETNLERRRSTYNF